MAQLNASSLTDKERVLNDFYATPSDAVEKLLEHEEFSKVWECACGQGHISKVLNAHGILHRSSDLIDRQYGEIENFLQSHYRHWGDIVTNPPFSKSTEFVYKAMDLLEDGRKLALLLRIQFLESVKRKTLFEQHPPKHIYVFSRTIRCARNGDFEHATGNASTYAWFVWVKGFYGEPTVRWI